MKQRTARIEERISVSSPRRTLIVLEKKGSFSGSLATQQMSNAFLKAVDAHAVLDEENERKHKHRAIRVFSDWKDDSRHPSYTNFKVPYHIQCRDRYVRTRKMYEDQFQHEIAELLQQQSSAYEAARFQRHISISTLWPPLHNRREIETVERSFFRVNRKQRKHCDYILSTNIT